MRIRKRASKSDSTEELPEELNKLGGVLVRGSPPHHARPPTTGKPLAILLCSCCGGPSTAATRTPTDVRPTFSKMLPFNDHAYFHRKKICVHFPAMSRTSYSSMPKQPKKQPTQTNKVHQHYSRASSKVHQNYSRASSKHTCPTRSRFGRFVVIVNAHA